MSGVFAAGDLVLLLDARDRRYLVDLTAGGEFHSHAGIVAHDQIIGSAEGVRVRSSGGKTYTAHRPTLREYVLKMKRGAQVIYPKDSAAIVMWGDVYPGANVVEAGIGSGGLTLALLRAVGAHGRVTSYEVREDHAATATRNIERFMGRVPNHTLRIGDVAAELDGDEVDRIFLDLPEPWRAVDATLRVLRGGGLVVTYLPTVPQVQSTVESFGSAGCDVIETFEVLHRTWNVAGKSVRPDHSMVAHTGFVSVFRRAAG